MYVCFFFFFFFLIMVWNYYFISARWLPPLRINKVKVKVNLLGNSLRLRFFRVRSQKERIVSHNAMVSINRGV